MHSELPVSTRKALANPPVQISIGDSMVGSRIINSTSTINDTPRNLPYFNPGGFQIVFQRLKSSTGIYGRPTRENIHCCILEFGLKFRF